MDIKLFESKQVRSVWSELEQKWYFVVEDVIEVLTESSVPKRYWSDLKKKLQNEGSQLYDFLVQLKLESSDGKKYATDCADTESLLRVIQSVPSPKAEPFKVWLAKVGYERMQEIENSILNECDNEMKNLLKGGYNLYPPLHCPVTVRKNYSELPG